MHWLMVSLFFFLEENETPFPEVGQAVEWRKDDGFSVDQGRDKKRGRGERSFRQQWGENSQTSLGLTKQFNYVNPELPISKTSAI